MAPLLPAKERAVAAADAALQQHGLCHSEVPAAFSLASIPLAAVSRQQGPHRHEAQAAFSLASIPLAGSDSIVFLLQRSGLAIKFFTDEVSFARCGL